eukprot:1157216-Pelagomonas_calceolata.AAC.2
MDKGARGGGRLAARGSCAWAEAAAAAAAAATAARCCAARNCRRAFSLSQRGGPGAWVRMCAGLGGAPVEGGVVACRGLQCCRCSGVGGERCSGSAGKLAQLLGLVLLPLLLGGGTKKGRWWHPLIREEHPVRGGGSCACSSACREQHALLATACCYGSCGSGGKLIACDLIGCPAPVSREAPDQVFDLAPDLVRHPLAADRLPSLSPVLQSLQLCFLHQWHHLAPAAAALAGVQHQAPGHSRKAACPQAAATAADVCPLVAAPAAAAAPPGCPQPGVAPAGARTAHVVRQTAKLTAGRGMGPLHCCCSAPSIKCLSLLVLPPPSCSTAAAGATMVLQALGKAATPPMVLPGPPSVIPLEWWVIPLGGCDFHHGELSGDGVLAASTSASCCCSSKIVARRAACTPKGNHPCQAKSACLRQLAMPDSSAGLLSQAVIPVALAVKLGSLFSD